MHANDVPESVGMATLVLKHVIVDVASTAVYLFVSDALIVIVALPGAT